MPKMTPKSKGKGPLSEPYTPTSITPPKAKPKMAKKKKAKAK
jgi:hypothetical protein